MWTTQNGSTNQAPRVRTLSQIMYIRHIMSSILIIGRNEGFKVSLVDSLYAARQHTVQNKERPNYLFYSLKTINSPAIVSTKLTGHK